jgi:SNF family Na+-dependent transporter
MDGNFESPDLAPLLGISHHAPLLQLQQHMINIAFNVSGVQIGVAECALILLFLFVIFLLIRNMTLDQEA